ncbi:MAG: hypothetical protein A2275_09160 [Bacteroidetes bacterium RIFOXYA12_FULL_35_11]|nr:MAG: hypothetical protein A2X01_01205 [Bacteroidetes bacterium GWF2_35_48]OFY73665.1 MAG: hypothetical protein A2275_09160 [Bacteroidetes bacterium RIFOXYA12_FULL_35_11]HBX51194.1 hypothetical protein [Bacteroidales bacterium]
MRLFFALLIILFCLGKAYSQEPDTSLSPAFAPDTNSTNPAITPDSNPTPDTTTTTPNTSDNPSISPDTTIIPSTDTSGFNYFYNEEEETKYLEYKPIIIVGTGIMSFYGEVSSTPKAHPVIGRVGFTLGVSKNLDEFLSVGLSAIMGKLSGQTVAGDMRYNFQTDIFCGSANLTYNFGHFLKKEGYLLALNKQYQVLPFISIGIEANNFNSKADIKDKNGNIYNYWSDGTIRNLPETAPNAATSVILVRDYKYETDLRDQNLDGLGRYSQTTISVPLHVGFDLNVHERITMRLGTSIHYNFSDNIDNFTSKGKGVRQGRSGGDTYIFSYVTFLLDIFSKEKIVNYDKFLADNPNISDFDKIYYADEDKDGVTDFDDQCIGTPLGVPVDKFGCPIDCDGDGIPDYLEKEEYNSTPGTVVDLYGNAYTDSMMLEMAADTAKFGVEYDFVEKYYPSLVSSAKSFESFADDIPQRFIHVDADNDGFISLEEFYNELDRYFDGRSKFQFEEIIELMEFFFMQEQ